MIKTGILGGTFDPIHAAHIDIARRVRNALSLKEVWLLPDGMPPHKRASAGPAHRLEMARLAIAGEPGFAVCDIETLRGGTTYTVDTLRQLRALHPEREWVYIIGGDTLDKLTTWHKFREIADLCEIAVVARADSDELDLRLLAEKLSREYGFRITLVHGGASDLSSSVIRRRAARGQSLKDMIPDAVARYIADAGLYRDERLDRLRAALTPARFTHTLGVEESARSLALCYGQDVEKAGEAALFHDCAKCGYSTEEMIALCEQNGVALEDVERSIPQILHAPAGAALAKSQYGVTEPEVLSAIRWHTTGHRGMTMLEKIVFLADAIEPTRRSYPGLDVIRGLAEHDIDKAICLSARGTQAYVASRSLKVNPITAEMLMELEGEGSGGKHA